MIIRDSIWKLIREQFTEEEKLELCAKFIGRVICLAGNAIDVDLLTLSLRIKLRDAISKAMELN